MAVVYGRLTIALYLFIGASLLDALDGYFARRLNQSTPLGAFLDPLADKFLIETSLILFVYKGWIPIWLWIIALSRDVIVVVGWLLIYMTTGTKAVKPSLIGKGAIASQLLLLCYVLLVINFPLFEGAREFLYVLTAGLTIVSGVHYIYGGFAAVNEKR